MRTGGLGVTPRFVLRPPPPHTQPQTRAGPLPSLSSFSRPLKWGPPQAAARSQEKNMPSVETGIQWAPNECQVFSPAADMARRAGRPQLLTLWPRILTQRARRGASGSRAWAGAGEEMPPLLAFASDLLLNKHISGLRVKYIGLQQSGRPFGDQLLILYKLLTYVATTIWMGELCGARPFWGAIQDVKKPYVWPARKASQPGAEVRSSPRTPGGGLWP